MKKVMSLFRRLLAPKRRELSQQDLDEFKHSTIFPNAKPKPLNGKDENENRLKEVVVRKGNLKRSITMEEDRKIFKLCYGDKSVDFKAECTGEGGEVHTIDMSKVEELVLAKLQKELPDVIHELLSDEEKKEVTKPKPNEDELPDVAPPEVGDEEETKVPVVQNRAGMIKEFFTECPELRHIPIVSKPTFTVTVASGETEAYAVKVQKFANLPIFLLHIKDKNIVGFSGMIVPESNAVHTKGECVVRFAELPKEASPDREFIVPTCKG